MARRNTKATALTAVGKVNTIRAEIALFLQERSTRLTSAEYVRFDRTDDALRDAAVQLQAVAEDA
jgi:hypothetical protein